MIMKLIAKEIVNGRSILTVDTISGQVIMDLPFCHRFNTDEQMIISYYDYLRYSKYIRKDRIDNIS